MLTAMMALALLGAQPAAPMDELVGKPIGAAVSRLGEPARVFDLDGGLRAFQWPSAGSPRTTVPAAEIYATPGALSPPAGAVASDDPEKVSGQGCYETLYAQWMLDDWFLMEHAPPPANCR